jgi:peptidoglycan/LPS O-acetylase OafA/YrhL
MRLPYRFGMNWLAGSLAVSAMLWFVLLAFGGALRGEFDPYNGGWHWQSAGLCLWESVVCVGICMGLIVGYRERFNRQGKFSRLFAANAFSIYVWHAPVLVALSAALVPFHADPAAKFAVLAVASIAATLALSEGVFRRIPYLKTILV